MERKESVNHSSEYIVDFESKTITLAAWSNAASVEKKKRKTNSTTKKRA
jgi:hypothetical protein